MSQRELPLGDAADADLNAVVGWIEAQSDAEVRIGDVIRRTIDEVLDGPRTGRFLYEDLANSEKTYTGTKLEILLREEFKLARGPAPKQLDFDIAGVAVDCKFSQSTSWMIPVEAVGEICLLVTASEETASFSVGFLRCRPELLGAANRDQKRSISKAGRAEATWVFASAPVPANLLRQLSERDRNEIMAKPESGQLRVNELFRRVHDQIVRREVTLTVARQDDGMKRRATPAGTCNLKASSFSATKASIRTLQLNLACRCHGRVSWWRRELSRLPHQDRPSSTLRAGSGARQAISTSTSPVPPRIAKTQRVAEMLDSVPIDGAIDRVSRKHL